MIGVGCEGSLYTLYPMLSWVVKGYIVFVWNIATVCDRCQTDDELCFFPRNYA